MTGKNFAAVRIVDDNAGYRASEAFMLRMFGYNVIEYGSALEFLENDDPAVPGCVVLDVKMPEMSGIELQQVMTEQGIGLPVIFLTGHGDVDMAVGTMHRGASDFLLKPVDPEKLRKSIGRAIEQCRARAAENETRERARELFAGLTPREQEVCRMAAKGLLNKQIAAELGISEHTVKVHRAGARFKLGARTPVDFVNLLKLAGEA